MEELLAAEENHTSHEKVKERDEEANVKQMQEAAVVAAEDEEAEHEKEDGGVVEVVVAYVDGKGIGMDVEARKEEHVLMEGTVDVGREIQTAAVGEC